MRTPLALHAGLAALLCVSLAACRDTAPGATTVPDPEPPAAAAGAAGDTGQAEVLDGELIASTNEPFWNARIDGAVLRLQGIESQRELAIDTSETANGTRTVRAIDANGSVELKFSGERCQDTMSGAMFPYTAALSIDGGALVHGCARPASMPPPGAGM